MGCAGMQNHGIRHKNKVYEVEYLLDKWLQAIAYHQG